MPFSWTSGSSILEPSFNTNIVGHPLALVANSISYFLMVLLMKFLRNSIFSGFICRYIEKESVNPADPNMVPNSRPIDHTDHPSDSYVATVKKRNTKKVTIATTQLNFDALNAVRPLYIY